MHPEIAQHVLCVRAESEPARGADLRIQQKPALSVDQQYPEQTHLLTIASNQFWRNVRT